MVPRQLIFSGVALWLCVLCNESLAVPSMPRTNLNYGFSGHTFVTNMPGSSVVTNSVSGFVAGCRWLIRVTPPDALDKGGVRYFEASFDGTNSYYFTPIKNIPTYSVNSSVAKIAQWAMPDEEAVSIIPTWLGLCSRCFFQDQPGDLLPILITTGGLEKMRNTGLRWPTKRKQSGAPPFFLDSLEIFTDGFFYSMDKRGNLVKGTRPPPMDKGYLAHRFTVISNRFLDQWIFPVHFELTSFTSPKNGDPTSSVPLLTRVVVIDSLHMIPNAEVDKLVFTPQVDGRVLTEDRRFVDANPPADSVRYINTNQSRWATVSEVKPLYLQEVEAQQRMKPADGSSFPSKRFVVFAIFVITALIYFFYVIQQRRTLK